MDRRGGDDALARLAQFREQRPRPILWPRLSQLERPHIDVSTDDAGVAGKIKRDRLHEIAIAVQIARICRQHRVVTRVDRVTGAFMASGVVRVEMTVAEPKGGVLV